MSHKIQRGQFYTQRNIFKLKAFQIWWQNIPKEKKSIILEPFAGSNNIIKNLKRLHLIENFKAFDIDPKSPDVEKLDTIAHFPKGFDVIVTNPPYLSRHSAKKKKIESNFQTSDDLYELALEKCLNNTSYVAAILPDSFINNKKYKDRLYAVVSLAYDDMFDDTEHPVCLALFIPQKTQDFLIYRNNYLLGNYQDLWNKKEQILQTDNEQYIIKFNVTDGNIHFPAVDNTKDNSCIRFTTEPVIESIEIKETSRVRTRIAIYRKNKLITNTLFLEKICRRANRILKRYRLDTKDIFMTSFKGLRKDGHYRRRLDFQTAKKILLKALEK